MSYVKDGGGEPLEAGDVFVDEASGRRWEVVEVRGPDLHEPGPNGEPRAAVVIADSISEFPVLSNVWDELWRPTCFKVIQ